MKRQGIMIVSYDEDVDAVYIKLSDEEPDGVVEVSEGVNVDTTTEGKITGIEILTASERFDVDTLLTYTLDLDSPLANHFQRV